MVFPITSDKPHLPQENIFFLFKIQYQQSFFIVAVSEFFGFCLSMVIVYPNIAENRIKLGFHTFIYFLDTKLIGISGCWFRI